MHQTGQIRTRQKNTAMNWFLIAVAVLMYSVMTIYVTENASLVRIQMVVRFAIIVFYLLTLLQDMLIRQYARVNGMKLFIGFMFVWQTIVSVYYSNSGMKDLFAEISNQSFWGACFNLFLRFSGKNGKEAWDRFRKILIVMLIAYSTRYLYWGVTRKADILSGAISAVYYIVALLPLFYWTPKAWEKILVAALVAVCVFVSEKRTAVVAYALAFIVPHFILLFRRERRKLRQIVLFTVLLGLMFILYDYIARQYGVGVFERLATAAEDGGSGRVEIYSSVMEEFRSMRPWERWFGKGYNAVAESGITSSSAHNDYLETVFDYGIIGLGLYLCVIWCAITRCIQLYKTKDPYAPVMLASISVFAAMSMFSHLLLYPTYFVFLLLFWAVGFSGSKTAVGGAKETKETNETNEAGNPHIP